MYRNHEHYPDPTAGRALGSLRRKENQLNTGKQFEAMHHYFELKTIETPSIPLEKILGRFDRERQKYHKLKHITDMAHAASFKGQTAHVVINYRGKVNRTFAVPASAVLEYMQTQTRKSIPWQWAALNGIEGEQHLLRVHWRYDVEGLLRVLEGGSTE